MAPEPPAACADSFEIALDQDPSTSEGAKGFGYFVLTNTGTVSCTLTGFTTAALIGDDGSTLSTQHDSDTFGLAETPVDVAPGGQAFIWKHWIDATQMGDECVEQQPVDYVDITLPGATTALHLDGGGIAACITPDIYSEFQLGPIDSEKRTASKGY